MNFDTPKYCFSTHYTVFQFNIPPFSLLILAFNSFPGEAVELGGTAKDGTGGVVEMGEAVALLLEAGKVVGGIRVGYQEVTFRWLVPDKVLDIGYRD